MLVVGLSTGTPSAINCCFFLSSRLVLFLPLHPTLFFTSVLSVSSSPSLSHSLISQLPLLSFMASGAGKGGPLPKFGEWDVNNPASAEGFTVIFNKVRDQKKTNARIAVGDTVPVQKSINDTTHQKSAPRKDKRAPKIYAEKVVVSLL
ncbi:hypothetical protein Ancab_002698 [Ancistrocladus abbreviatus]